MSISLNRHKHESMLMQHRSSIKNTAKVYLLTISMRRPFYHRVDILIIFRNFLSFSNDVVKPSLESTLKFFGKLYPQPFPRHRGPLIYHVIIPFFTRIISILRLLYRSNLSYSSGIASLLLQLQDLCASWQFSIVRFPPFDIGTI